MRKDFLSLFIERYLRTPASSFDRLAYRGLLHNAAPIAEVSKDVLLRRLPFEPFAASFITLGRRIGISAVTKSSPDATVEWAKTATTVLGKISPVDQDSVVTRYGKMTSEIVMPQEMVPGMFYTYKYEAEADDFDNFPVTLVLDVTKTSMLGLNFHYLPYALRFAFFEALMPLVAPIPVDQLSRINIVYQQLTGKTKFRAYAPSIKRYRFDRFKSNAVFITPLEWAIALCYPSHSFTGKSFNQVWQESYLSVY